TGVFTGAFCLNPDTEEPIPVLVADYALMHLGTGVFIAVPGHDERDFFFALAFGLPVPLLLSAPREHFDTSLTEAFARNGALVYSGEFAGLVVLEGKRRFVEWLAARGLGEWRINYRLRDWCISRQRYWGPPIAIVYCDACGAVPVPEDQLPVVIPRVEDFTP